MIRNFVFAVLLAFTAAGCAHRGVELVELPLRDADLYPNSYTNGAVTVAVDEIEDAERSKHYFGVDLTKKGILPVIVVISNHSDTQYNVHPSNILLRRGSHIIDPLPLSIVTTLAAEDRGGLPRAALEQFKSYFAGIGFSETVLNPYESYQGVIFFQLGKKKSRDDDDSFFRTISLFMEGRMKLHVVLTDRHSKQRRQFGPFSLSS